MTREPTPVSVWAPAFEQAGFKWLNEMPIEEVFEGPLKDYRREGQFRCRLCEVFVSRNDRKPHRRPHRPEYRAWKKSDKERINQLKREVV